MNEYSDEVSETRRIGRGSAILLVGRIINLILSFAVILMITWMLGPEKFGLYSFVMSIAAMVMTLTTLVNQGMLRYATQYLALNQTGKAKDIFSKSGRLLLIISGISLAGILFVSRYLSSFEFIVIALPFIYFGFFSMLIMTIFYILRKIHLFVLEGVLKNAFLVLFIPLLVGNYGLSGSLFAYDVAAFLTLLILAGYLYFSYWKGVSSDSANESTSGILKFSLPNFLSTLINNLTQRSGVFILTYFSFIYGMEEVGYFNLALTIILSISTILYAVPEAIISTVMKFKFQKRSSLIQEVVNTSLRYSLILAVPIVFSLAFVSDPVVNLVFNKEFGRAGLNIAILSFYLFTLIIIKNFISVIIANDDVRYLFYADVVSFIIFIISSVMLIPSLASRGIAISLLLGSIGSAIIYIWRASRFGIFFPVGSVMKIILPGMIFLPLATLQPDIAVLLPSAIAVIIAYYFILYLLKELRYSDIKRIIDIIK